MKASVAIQVLPDVSNEHLLSPLTNFLHNLRRLVYNSNTFNIYSYLIYI